MLGKWGWIGNILGMLLNGFGIIVCLCICCISWEVWCLGGCIKGVLLELLIYKNYFFGSGIVSGL